MAKKEAKKQTAWMCKKHRKMFRKYILDIYAKMDELEKRVKELEWWTP